MHVGLTVGLALLAAMCAAHEDATAGLAPFVLGSRYGRGARQDPPRALVPRNDRFFMGSRYGKRAELPPPDDGVDDLAAAEPPAERGVERGVERGAGRGAALLACRYTGVETLYRCRAERGREVTPSLGGGRASQPAEDE